MIKIDFNKSIGSYAWDKETNSPYLDLFNHYSSVPLGYNHEIFSSPEFIETVRRVSQIKTALGKYECDEEREFFWNFTDYVTRHQYKWFHFCCTGSLAVETAAKILWERSGTPDVLVIKNNFHGINSFGNYLSNGFSVGNRTSNVPCWRDSPFNVVHPNKDAVIYALRFRKYSAIIVEPIQCTAGDIYLDSDFIQWLFSEGRYLGAGNHPIPVVFDEIQTGFGATGKWWYYEHLGVTPDMVIFGKKAQVSGVMCEYDLDAIFDNREKLSVTFDGDLIDMVRATYIIKAINENNLLLNIEKMGTRIVEALNKFEFAKNARGIGGIIAFDCKNTAVMNDVFRQLFNNRVLCNPTGEKTIRLRPNLNFQQRELEQFEHALSKIKL